MDVPLSGIGEVLHDLVAGYSAVGWVGAACLHACWGEEEALRLHVCGVAVDVVLLCDEAFGL